MFSYECATANVTLENVINPFLKIKATDLEETGSEGCDKHSASFLISFGKLFFMLQNKNSLKE